MPPDPILALLSAVGLLVYGVVGAVVSVFAMKYLGTSNDRMGKISRWELDKDATQSFIAWTIFWPLPAAVLLVIGIALVPGFFVKRVGQYVAGSLDK